jgi:hypothetical protein
MKDLRKMGTAGRINEDRTSDHNGAVAFFRKFQP